MIKYVLPLLLTTSAFASSPFNPDPIEYYEMAAAAHQKAHPPKMVRKLDITEILEDMENLAKAAKEEPYNLYLFVFMMEEEIHKCKAWLSLQHSN